jgi:hypothetical protein
MLHIGNSLLCLLPTAALNQKGIRSGFFLIILFCKHKDPVGRREPIGLS